MVTCTPAFKGINTEQSEVFVRGDEGLKVMVDRQEPEWRLCGGGIRFHGAPSRIEPDLTMSRTMTKSCKPV